MDQSIPFDFNNENSQGSIFTLLLFHNNNNVNNIIQSIKKNIVYVNIGRGSLSS